MRTLVNWGLKLWLVIVLIVGITLYWQRETTEPDNFIVFGAEGEIYRIDSQGQRLKNITHSIAYASEPTWSPDGTAITFRGAIPGERSSGLYIASLMGLNTQALASANLSDHLFWGVHSPSWSPNNDWIVFGVSGSDRPNITTHDLSLYRIRPDGSHLTPIINMGEVSYLDLDRFTQSAWSPDGNYMAFSFVQDEITHLCFLALAVHELDCQPTVQTHLQDLTWSPNGKFLAYSAWKRTGSGGFEIYLLAIDTMIPVNLSQARANDSQPTWSPDSQSLAFSSQRDNNEEIYRIDLDGKNLINLSQDFAQDTKPQWSPNGQMIVFESVRDGNRELYLVRPDGTQLRNLTQNSSDDQDAMWGSIEGSSPPWRPQVVASSLLILYIGSHLFRKRI